MHPCVRAVHTYVRVVCTGSAYRPLVDDEVVAVDVRFGIRFTIAQRTLPWQPIVGAKSAKIGDTPSFLRLAFHNGWQDGKVYGRTNTP